MYWLLFTLGGISQQGYLRPTEHRRRTRQDGVSSKNKVLYAKGALKLSKRAERRGSLPSTHRYTLSARTRAHTMDQVHQVTNNTASLVLDDSPSLDWVLARASKIFPKEGDISKTSLVFYQSPANFYAGSAVTQAGDGLSRAGRTRESSVCMRDVAAPGMLKFLSQDKGQELHKDLTHDMMGRTTLHGERKGSTPGAVSGARRYLIPGTLLCS